VAAVAQCVQPSEHGFPAGLRGEVGDGVQQSADVRVDREGVDGAGRHPARGDAEFGDRLGDVFRQVAGDTPGQLNLSGPSIGFRSGAGEGLGVVWAPNRMVTNWPSAPATSRCAAAAAWCTSRASVVASRWVVGASGGFALLASVVSMVSWPGSWGSSRMTAWKCGQARRCISTIFTNDTLIRVGSAPFPLSSRRTSRRRVVVNRAHSPGACQLNSTWAG